jgi:GT2 family glycosyltransferase
MTDLRLSVVIPTVGGDSALARCLDALLAATVRPYEIVVVDQSGEGAIAGVLAKRRETFPRLLHRVEERRGLSAARNAGARGATGDLIAFTDDDCVPEAHWVRAILAAFADVPRLAGVTGPMLPLPTDVLGLVAVSSRTSLERVDYRHATAPWVVGTGGNLTLRRGWLEHVGGWDERLGVGSRGEAGEDVALIDQVLASGGALRYEPDAVVRHEQRSRSSRRATRRTYGHGVGAACGILLHESEARGIVLLGRWLGFRLRLATAALARGRADAALDEARILAGTLVGLLYGLRAHDDRGVHGQRSGYRRRKR